MGGISVLLGGIGFLGAIVTCVLNTGWLYRTFPKMSPGATIFSTCALIILTIPTWPIWAIIHAIAYLIRRSRTVQS